MLLKNIFLSISLKNIKKLKFHSKKEFEILFKFEIWNEIKQESFEISLKK